MLRSHLLLFSWELFFISPPHFSIGFLAFFILYFVKLFTYLGYWPFVSVMYCKYVSQFVIHIFTFLRCIIFPCRFCLSDQMYPFSSPITSGSFESWRRVIVFFSFHLHADFYSLNWDQSLIISKPPVDYDFTHIHSFWVTVPLEGHSMRTGFPRRWSFTCRDYGMVPLGITPPGNRGRVGLWSLQTSGSAHLMGSSGAWMAL